MYSILAQYNGFVKWTGPNKCSLLCLPIVFLFQKLESQLRDVAYGTRQFRIQPPTDEQVCSILCHTHREFNPLLHMTSHRSSALQSSDKQFHQSRNSEVACVK